MFPHLFTETWYQPRRNVFCYLLFPLSWLFGIIIHFRHRLYQRKIFKTTTIPKPVIVVGNLTAGGTGKTPLVIALADFLQRRGKRVGIISRGYGGKQSRRVRYVKADSDPCHVGDEAVLMAKRTHCSVAISTSRVRAAQALASTCDVILSDDGLQHYALKRDIEILLIDGKRRFGNACLLPAGPLREPLQRLQTVDFIVENSGLLRGAPYIPMQLVGMYAHSLKHLSERIELTELRGKKVHAVAAIGNPERFFNLLHTFGLQIIQHVFSDHHIFTAEDLSFATGAHKVLMTEKDAVKCGAFSHLNLWYVPVDAMLPDSFYEEVWKKL